jgi:RNA polymerase primary sigma factor
MGYQQMSEVHATQLELAESEATALGAHKGQPVSGPEDGVRLPADEFQIDTIKMYLRDIQKTKLLSPEEERNLALRVAQGDLEARELMITANLRLVVNIAKRYRDRGLPYLDLIEEGNLGLIKAVERFEVTRGFRLSTYATWWIRQSIERALVNQSHTIRIPVHVAEEISKYWRVTKQFVERHNRDPTLAETAREMGLESNRVRTLRVLMMGTYSLDHPMGEEHDYCLSDMIGDSSTGDPVSRIDDADAYRRLVTLIGACTEAEKRVLTLRYGLDDQEPQTLESIGRRFGVSRERIRQIEAASLLKLRKLMLCEDAEGATC